MPVGDGGGEEVVEEDVPHRLDAVGVRGLEVVVDDAESVVRSLGKKVGNRMLGDDGL